MNDRAFLDTNVLIYAFAAGDKRADIAERLLAQGGAISVQVLNEFASVARRKLGMGWAEVNEALGAIRAVCGTAMPVTLALHDAALALARRTRYGIYDALILAAAIEAGCATLYTEDMRDGQVIEGVTIRNPFAR